MIWHITLRLLLEMLLHHGDKAFSATFPENKRTGNVLKKGSAEAQHSHQYLSFQAAHHPFGCPKCYSDRQFSIPFIDKAKSNSVVNIYAQQLS